jgi:hypothetical protein
MLPPFDFSSPVSQFLEDFIVIKSAFYRCVGRDMIAHGHDETRAVLSDIYTAFNLGPYLLSGTA